MVNEILSDIAYRAGRDTIRRRMYELNNPSQLEATTEAPTHSKYNRRRAGALGTAAYLIFLWGCGGNGSPTQPSTNKVTLQVYNATTGQSKEMTFEVLSGSSSVSVNAADLVNGLGDVVTSEFAVRNMGADNSLGSLVVAAGSQA